MLTRASSSLGSDGKNVAEFACNSKPAPLDVAKRAGELRYLSDVRI